MEWKQRHLTFGDGPHNFDNGLNFGLWTMDMIWNPIYLIKDLILDSDFGFIFAVFRVI